MFDSSHDSGAKERGLPGSATCIDTDRTFFQALGSGLGVGEKRGGRGDQEGKAGKRQIGDHSLTHCML